MKGGDIHRTFVYSLLTLMKGGEKDICIIEHTCKLRYAVSPPLMRRDTPAGGGVVLLQSLFATNKIAILKTPIYAVYQH